MLHRRQPAHTTATSSRKAQPPMTPPLTPATSPDTLTIRPAGRDEADTIAAVITEAFLSIPPTEWLLPDPVVRSCVFPLYLRIFIDHALTHGQVDVATATGTDTPLATAIWWRNAFQPAEYTRRLAEVMPRHSLARFGIYDGYRESRHPTSPHCYLAFAATLPEHQGRGIGTHLVSHRLHQLDANGEASFLIATSEDAARLCRRLGYEDRTPYQLPCGPCMYPQVRAPHADADTAADRKEH